ncbi:STAS domain-containing protein [Kitasatospora sp. NPDC059327]|uniref:STAS domain-containing protein n=1 Tax=Kitasatospora sp. NPDC059327 TaxID=3346803 RepID=UPI0036A46A40
MDSSGLNALLLARAEAARADTTVHLARLTPSAARLLETTGADQVFPIDPDVPAAGFAR